MLYSSLQELKAELEIDPNDRSEDLKLSLFLEQASSWIGEYLNRPGFSKASRTEYYGGTGTKSLLLRSRPVFTTPAIQVNVDEAGWFGSASGSFGPTTALVYGTDFCLKIDQPDGTSRCGILLRMNNFWNKATLRQPGLLSPFLGALPGSILITYTAGYTVDSLPPAFRTAILMVVAKLRYLFPLGVELSAESYEDRAISVSAITQQKDFVMSQAKSILVYYRNWSW